MKSVDENDDKLVAPENMDDDVNNEEEKQEIIESSQDEEALTSNPRSDGNTRVSIDPPEQKNKQDSKEDPSATARPGDSSSFAGKQKQKNGTRENKKKTQWWCGTVSENKVIAFALVLVIILLAFIIASLGIILRDEKQKDSSDNASTSPESSPTVAPTTPTPAPTENVFALDTIQHVQVISPKGLSKPDGYEWIPALFGPSKLDNNTAILQADVYYSDSNLCDPNLDIMEQAYPLEPLLESNNNENKPRSKPFILMGNRGGCTFVKKVRTAQMVGASLAIIADNKCLCSASHICVDDDINTCETLNAIMADDGSGSDIIIPSFLLSKQDADPIKFALKEKNQYVTMEVSWIPQDDDDDEDKDKDGDDDVVKFDLFTTPSDTIGRNFLREFKDYALALNENTTRMKFTPHLYIYSGTKAGCVSPDGENICYNLCTNNGRYCATDPDNELDSGISGADVVRESLRQLCIWEIYGAADETNGGIEWWEYIDFFHEFCSGSAVWFANDSCLGRAMVSANISPEKVGDCMEFTSGGLDGNVQNEFFERAIKEQEDTAIITIPTFFVNDSIILENNALGVLRKICDALESAPFPDVCRSN